MVCTKGVHATAADDDWWTIPTCLAALWTIVIQMVQLRLRCWSCCYIGVDLNLREWSTHVKVLMRKWSLIWLQSQFSTHMTLDPAKLFAIAVIVGFSPTSSAVNFNQCLNSIYNMTTNGTGGINGTLFYPLTSKALAVTYDFCVDHCGAGQEPFKWTVFSEQFSLWLLPCLALLSQLPFGVNDKLDNLESMLLTLRSPTLATYSLALTVLNGWWISQLFSKHM